jgi:hypothetical protein
MAHGSSLDSFLPEFNGRTWSQAGAPEHITLGAFYQPVDGVQLDVAYATAPQRPLSAESRTFSNPWFCPMREDRRLSPP